MEKSTGMFHRVDISRKKDMQVFLRVVGLIYGKEVACKALDIKLARWSNLKETSAPIGEDGEQLVFVKLKRIIPYRRVSVYDIEYPNKGWFIANEYKVHNTGKTTTVAVTGIGMAVILPVLAKHYPQIEELQTFKDGFWVGI